MVKRFGTLLVSMLVLSPAVGALTAGAASAAETCVPGVTAVKVCAEAGFDDGGDLVVGADVTQPGTEKVAGERVEVGQRSSGDVFAHSMTEVPVYPGFVAPGVSAGRNEAGDPWVSAQVNIGGFLVISTGTTANNDPLGEGNVCVTSYDPDPSTTCVSMCPPFTTICDPPQSAATGGEAVLADEARK
jgi:hypothetical protein